MAGFMAGFGSAFSQSFNQGNAINAQKEQDMFRLKYADYISKRDEITQQKKIDAQNVSGAKQLAKMYAGNEQAWSEIYKMKQSGLDDSQIVKFLSENEAQITPTSTATGDTSGPADPRDALPVKAGESVDAQMKASGMATPQPGEGLFGGMFKGRQGRVDSDIAQATGSTPEQVNSTLAGETPSGEPIAGAPDLTVSWKPKKDTKAALEQQKLGLDTKKYELEVQEFELKKKLQENPQMSPAEKAEHELNLSKFALEKRKTDLEIYQMEHPEMTPHEQAQMELETAKLKLATLEFESNQSKPLTVAEGTAVVSPKGEELYKNPKAPDLDWMKPKDPQDAKNNLIIAEREGNPDKIKMAQDLYNSSVAEANAQARRGAEAKGELYSSGMGFQSNGSLAVQRNGVWIDSVSEKPLGEGDVQPIQKEDMALLDNIRKKSESISKPYRENASTFVSSIRDVNDMQKIVDENPGVLNFGAKAAQFADDTVRNVASVVSLFDGGALKAADANGMISPQYIKQLSDAERDLQTKMDNMVGPEFSNNVAKLAMARSLFEIKNVKLAYAKASSVGQSGAGVAAKEFDRFYNAGMPANPEAFKKENKDFLLNQYAKLKQEGQAINAFDPDAEQFRLKTGFNAPIKMAPDIDNILDMTDPEAKKILQTYQHQGDKVNPVTSNPNQMNTQQEIPAGYKPTGTYTKDGKALYLSPDGTKGTLD